MNAWQRENKKISLYYKKSNLEKPKMILSSQVIKINIRIINNINIRIINLIFILELLI